ncbi:response regulator transcription factor [uncultured Campylobacter sp.]|uniref:response regulator transcription factor n=1 Tax=uncultured Campylobacter sp. TaxID=218934 RepID=UPI0026374FDB|nr:response regulator transcription factor [uncultured Campylobacter sp.]
MKILLVEDEKDLNQIITKCLKKDGYSVDCAFCGKEALEFLDVAKYDAIVLDAMMPVMDGFEFLKVARARRLGTPVLFLTARDAKEDIIAGLDLGADDYMVKPFDFRELLARLRAIIRRKNATADNEIIIGQVRLNLSKKSVVCAGKVVELTGKEYRILELLMLNRGAILSREQIGESIWDFSDETSSNVIDVLIKNIRKKLGEHGDIIETKRGLGYVVAK